MKKWILAGGLAVLLTLTALALPQEAAPAAPADLEQQVENDWTRRWKYTQADYRLALSLQTEGCEKLSVGAFNQNLMDGENEDQFHRREEAYRRLMNSYPHDGAGADFIYLTLSASFDECTTKHYGGHCDRMTPTFRDGAAKVREEDVFGDRYPVFEATADYDLPYRIEDESKLTVGERDRVILAYRQAVQAFLDGKTEAQLKDEKAMAKALGTELKRLDGQLSTQLMTLTGTQLSCYDADDYRD